jgi:Phospholipase_D-nuclease N-terminal
MDAEQRSSMTQTKRQLAPGERAVFGILGIAQAALAFLAFWDLAHRPAVQVRGPKLLWTPVILINWIGPLAYFFAHRAR